MGCRSSVIAVALAACALAGCGTQQSSGPPPSQQETTSALRGSPSPLAALHAQANRLLPGGATAFKARLTALHGYPVVVNKWASWCGPCQNEFPVLQRASLRFGRQVAFVGIDGKDHDPAAAAFLRSHPVSYPSYSDPEESIARAMEAATYYPQTLFVDRRGKVVYDHAGPYLTVGALQADIERYVLAPK